MHCHSAAAQCMAVPYEQMIKYAVIARLVALDNGSCAWHITRAPTSALKDACQTTRVCAYNTMARWGFAEVGILACSAMQVGAVA